MKPKLISILSTLVVAIVGLSLISVPVAAAPGVGAWAMTTSYPTNVGFKSCVTSGGFIYCVGGYVGLYTSAVYFAKLGPGGVGAWAMTTSYPISIDGLSCVVSGPILPSYIYCVGGDNNGVATNDVYFAKLGPAGIPPAGAPGTWTMTTSYPIGLSDGLSCVTSGGFIYCVGGYNAANVYTSDVYSAKLGPAGIPPAGAPGTWTMTTSYANGATAITFLSCVVAGGGRGSIFCVGGFDNGVVTAAVYSAPLVGPGVLGAWATSPNPYPVSIDGHSCVSSGAQIVCVGGDNPLIFSAVYFAILGPGGLGAWAATTSYPINIAVESCVVSGPVLSSFIYCVGGYTGTTGFSPTYTGAAYYAPF